MDSRISTAESTRNLDLQYLAAGQAQKHVTLHEALRTLDALNHLAVVDRDLAVLPGSQTEGARYIIGLTPKGAWAGRSGQVAVWRGAAWVLGTGGGTSRERLTAVRTYFVRPDGNDGQSGLANSAAQAFRTMQRAIDVVGGLDLGTFSVTIQAADGL